MQLLRKDNSNFIRVAEIRQEHHGSFHVITRATGLLGGIMTKQPDIEIYSGKANRTAEEQASLEFNSMLNNYLDKGYKLITDYGITDVSELTGAIIARIRLEKLTDTRGVAKHMLAKTAWEMYDRRYNKLWYASYKIDGVRCSLHYDMINDSIYTSSRGGKSFEPTTKHLTQNEALLTLFRRNPHLVLDGELYIHGKPLTFISGLSRLKYYDPKVHDMLDYYIFDVIDDHEFRTRNTVLKEIEEVLQNIVFDLGNYSLMDHIKFVEHEDTYSYSDVLEMHTRAVEDGFEGLVLRDPDGLYGHGSRDWRMVKIKMFTDDEFTIIGSTQGLRDEDMVFVCMSHNGKPFEAKPVGTREQRIHYSHHADLYKGKKATVKFFGYTPYGIPNLPVLKYIVD